MKIVFTIAGLHPESGGPSQSVPALCQALARDGVDVEIISLDYGGKVGQPRSPARASATQSSSLFSAPPPTSPLRAPCSPLPAPISHLPSPISQLPAPLSALSAPSSQPQGEVSTPSPTPPTSQLPAPSSQLPAPTYPLRLDRGEGQGEVSTPSSLLPAPCSKLPTLTFVDCSSALARRTQWTSRFKSVLRDRSRRTGVQIIHDTGLWLLTNHAAARVSDELNVPRIVSPRGMLTAWALQHKGWKKRIAWMLYQQRDLQMAYVLHATSPAEVADFRNAGLTQPIAMIPNGVELPPLPAPCSPLPAPISHLPTPTSLLPAPCSQPQGEVSTQPPTPPSSEPPAPRSDLPSPSPLRLDRGLELPGRQRKEFGEAEGAARRVSGASESLGEGEVSTPPPSSALPAPRSDLPSPYPLRLDRGEGQGEVSTPPSPLPTPNSDLGSPISDLPLPTPPSPLPAPCSLLQTPPRTALFLGRIHPIKGLLDLVKAWALVRPQGWRVVIAGGDESNHRAEVEAAVRALGLTGDFSFIGPVAGDAKWSLYQQADLFLLPSHSENFGIVVAEALASGVPVITTRATPWEELVTQRCGWWTENGPEPLAAALRDAMNRTDDERREMGMRGRQLVEQKYSWPGIAAQMHAVYRWMLGEGEKPACVVLK